MDETLYCEYKDGYVQCTAPDTSCEHWQGSFCDYDLESKCWSSTTVVQRICNP